jgi:hypothetical protein
LAVAGDKVDTLVAEAGVEIGLPHGDAEYEAWARKHYPHVMAFYDILTGKPAEVRPDLPEDVRTCLARFADRSKMSDQIMWDGKPVNVPGWAARLYAHTPEPERATGWRALLIYSGEIFKVDWPGSVGPAVVRPSVEGVWNAAFVAGCADAAAPSFECISPSEMPEGYVHMLLGNRKLTEEMLGHAAVASRLVRTPSFDELADSATTALVSLHATRTPDCSSRLEGSLTGFFDEREETLAILGGVGLASR